MALGAVIAGGGDVICQRYFPTPSPAGADGATPSADAPSIDWRRTLDMSLIRAFVMAPFLHVYFPWLARLVPGQSAPRILLRVAADQAIGAPITLPLIFAASSLLQGHPEHFVPRLREQMLPTWATGATFWPFVHMINFRFVRVSNQPLVAHVVSIYWNVVLSYRSNIALTGDGGGAVGDAAVTSASPILLAWASTTAAAVSGLFAPSLAPALVTAPPISPPDALGARPCASAEHRHPLLAGALTGAAEISCTYPLEYVKTQLQLQNSASPVFRGSLDCARQTFERFGLAGFYRGFLSNFVGALPRSALRFSTFEYVSGAMREHERTLVVGSDDRLSARLPPLTAVQSFFAGLVAGVVEAVLIIVPMTTLQVKLIADMNRSVPQYRGLAHAIATIAREEGLGGLYRGAGPTLLKIAINISCRFLMYNELVAWLTAQWHFRDEARHAAWAAAPAPMPPAPVPWSEAWRFSVVSMAAGAVAGAVTVVGNHPIDVVKSNMQSLHAQRYASALDCLRVIAREEGLRGLYKGLAPRLNRVVLETSLSFTFFAHLSHACNVAMDGRE